ncbi:MAG TPA: response regulator [Spirochaetota bacterium]|nr:response regulator [Spirochaetota bacterium]HPI88268.1 response regulator [Spirochaetota bacterium]HPR50014.1 response regulator [Spirochaetota bacterium]
MSNYIMVIDDSPTIRASVEISVKSLGIPVKQAENGIDALNKIKGIKDSGDDVALCVCDINMPQMDGISFIKEFRKTDKFTPVVVLTTESEESRIQEGKDAGAAGWLIKPFKPEQLLSVIERFIKK